MTIIAKTMDWHRKSDSRSSNSRYILCTTSVIGDIIICEFRSLLDCHPIFILYIYATAIRLLTLTFNSFPKTHRRKYSCKSVRSHKQRNKLFTFKVRSTCSRDIAHLHHKKQTLRYTLTCFPSQPLITTPHPKDILHTDLPFIHLYTGIRMLNV